MKNKNVYKMLLIFYLTSVSNITYSFDQNVILKKLEGEWGYETWYSTLEKTKSPRKSILSIREENRYLSCIKFNTKVNENGFYNISLNYSFHEGDNRSFNKIRPLDAKHNEFTFEIISYTTDQFNNKLWAFAVDIVSNVKFFDKNHISFTTKESNIPTSNWIGGIFVKLEPSLIEFVNKTVVSGVYKDNLEKHYEFYSNGKLLWDEQQMEYEINHYVNETRCDSFTIKSGSNTIKYVYEIISNKLFIYKIQYVEECIEDKIEPPYLILEKVK